MGYKEGTGRTHSMFIGPALKVKPAVSATREAFSPGASTLTRPCFRPHSRPSLGPHSALVGLTALKM